MSTKKRIGIGNLTKNRVVFTDGWKTMVYSVPENVNVMPFHGTYSSSEANGLIRWLKGVGGRLEGKTRRDLSLSDVWCLFRQKDVERLDLQELYGHHRFLMEKRDIAYQDKDWKLYGRVKKELEFTRGQLEKRRNVGEKPKWRWEFRPSRLSDEIEHAGRQFDTSANGMEKWYCQKSSGSSRARLGKRMDETWYFALENNLSPRAAYQLMKEKENPVNELDENALLGDDSLTRRATSLLEEANV